MSEVKPHPDIIRENIVSISVKDCLTSFLEITSSIELSPHDYLDAFFFACASGSENIVSYLLENDTIHLNNCMSGAIQSVVNNKLNTFD